ncbi:cytochrome P450 [Aspergillus stella-maris]|uniref:cytochrome P450 n=1 Tax=Aspergillus stella-maris TaxID=1810926 RepID=UPI003CCE49C0
MALLSGLVSTLELHNGISLILLGIAVYALFFVMDYIRDPLKSIPGPIAARYTRLWYFFKVKKGDFHLENIELHRKYGNVVRIAPNVYSIDDLEATKIVYGHGSKFLKSDWYSTFTISDVADVNTFTLRDVKKHAAVRRLFANNYTMSSMIHYEAYVDMCIRTFENSLEKRSDEKQKMDMGNWLQYYAFDVIGNITFGKSFGFVEKGEDINGMMAEIDQANLYGSLGGIFPLLYAFVMRFAAYPMQGIGDWVMDVINERRKKVAKGEHTPTDDQGTEDFLDKNLKAHELNPTVFTATHLLFGTAGNLFAGSDTTSIVLSAIVFHLWANPSCLAKLREEINVALKERRVSDPITFAESQKLPYFQAVLKEGLRINPSVGLPLVRVVPPGGTTLCGKFFPAGTVVGVNSWVAHHNKSVFGADAGSFRPERWLEGVTPEMERYFMPFGLGSRSCLGKNISLLEMGKLIPQLVRNFDFELERTDKLVANNWWLVKPKGFVATPRKL